MSEHSGDRNPSSYVIGHEEDVLKGFATRTAENSAAYLLPSLKPTFSVLDVGCGSGTITRALARICADGRAVGVDASAAVVQQAVSDTESTDVDSCVSFQVADAAALPFADGSFDVVHAHQLLQHVPDAAAVLREMRRVVRPGGLVALRVACVQIVPSDGLERLHQLSEAATSAIAAGGGDPLVAQKLPRLARVAGYQDVWIGSSMMSYVSKEERGVLARLWEGALQNTSMKGMSRTTAGDDAKGLDDIREVLHTLATAEDAFFLVPNVEVLCTK